MRPSNFFGSESFLVALEWGFKETLWSLGSGQLERDGKLKFWIGWTLISIFLGLVQKSQTFLNRLLTIFHKSQENFKRKIKMIKLSFH
jgi:hypothetical protein